MLDPLTRICGLPDLSAGDRQRLTAELEFITDLLSRIDQGAGFCEDRGFGWSAEMERAEGADRLLARLREWPILRRLLPRLRHLRHQTDPIIGREAPPTDDILVAELVLANTRSFDECYGEGFGERRVTVRLEADLIRWSEESLATTVGGQPFDASEATADYSADRYGVFWRGVQEKLPMDIWRRATALAERKGGTVVPCDLCGRTSQTLAIVGSLLTYGGPFAAPASLEIGPDARAALREAFTAHDMPAIRRLNPEWTKGFCADCDASYCQNHPSPARAGAEDLPLNLSACCPFGHCW